jgi:hypothetical protein
LDASLETVRPVYARDLGAREEDLGMTDEKEGSD